MAKRINVDEVLSLHSEGKSNKEIAQELGRDPHAIGRILKQKNLLPNGSGRDFIKISNLDVLIGTLLGDSSLKYGCAKYPCLSFNHTLPQKDYYLHKVSLFSYLSTGKHFKSYIPTNSFGTKEVYSFNTKYLKSLQEIESIFYINRQKQIPIDFLNQHFTEKSLAYLFMDDGNINGKTVNLNLQSFSKEDLNKFILFLKDKFNLLWTIQKNKTYYRLYLKKISISCFIELISPYIIDSMKYKLPKCRH